MHLQRCRTEVRVAHSTHRGPVRLDSLLSSFDPCSNEHHDYCVTSAEVDLVRSLPFEGRVGHDLVVLPHVEVNESAEGLDAVQRVQVEPGALRPLSTEEVGELLRELLGADLSSARIRATGIER